MNFFLKKIYFSKDPSSNKGRGPRALDTCLWGASRVVLGHEPHYRPSMDQAHN